MPPRRTKKQKEHSLHSMLAINCRRAAQQPGANDSGMAQASGNPGAGEVFQLKKKVLQSTTKLIEVTRKLKNRTMGATRAKNTCRALRELNNKLKDAARKQKERGPKKTEIAVKKALKYLDRQPGEAYLKSKTVITEESREMIRDLSMANVPDRSINKVIHAVGKWLGMDVKDAVSERSVARVIQGRGIAAKMQIVDENGGTGHVPSTHL